MTSLTIAAGNSTQTSKDAVLQADFRILGQDVLPFNSSKQNAVIVGIANVLGNQVALSDISLSVLKTYDVRCLTLPDNPCGTSLPRSMPVLQLQILPTCFISA